MIGFYGYPNEEILDKYKDKELIDLDIDYNNPQNNILTNTSCAIINNIINNALFLKNKLELIICSTGNEKCDQGRIVYNILKDIGFNVIKSENNNKIRSEIKISRSYMPLRKKINLITQGIIKKEKLELQICKPSVGFWGVPPNDLRLLDLFPDDTHVYGWLRCVEASCPSDLELELYVNRNIKTVFFSQSFCSKQILAKYLADKYNGLYIDINRKVSISTLSKVEAFIKFS